MKSMHRPARRRMSRLPEAWLLAVALLGLAMPPVAEAQFSGTALGLPEFQNRIYTNPPPSVPGGGSPQAQAITFTAAGHQSLSLATAPTDGQFRLVGSLVGQPVEGAIPQIPDFLLGQSITNLPPGASLAFAPGIFPPEKAFYVTNAQQLFASEPGFVTITWRSATGVAVATNRYLVSSQPATAPTSMYWTEQGGTNTGAPAIDFTSGPLVIPHHNSMIPTNSLWLDGDRLKASGASGLIVLEYHDRSNFAFLGLEIVEVRPYAPKDGGVADVGVFLTPSDDAASPARPVVARGLNNSPPSAYQHSRPGEEGDGEIIAIRPTAPGDEIDVCWTRVAAQGVVWPYELSRYVAKWPEDFDQRAQRLYVTESGSNARTKAPLVDVTAVSNVLAICYNSVIADASHFWLDAQGLLHAKKEGKILLTYDGLTLQFVDIRSHDTPDTNSTVDVGTFLAPQYVPPNPARPYASALLTGSAEPFVHQHTLAIDAANDGKLIVTRPAGPGNAVDIFWRQVGISNVVWPYELHRYSAQWPANFDQISRAIYWTQLSGGTPTKAPPVFIPGLAVPRVRVFYNSEIPTGYDEVLLRSTNLWLETSSRQLQASHRVGRILLWYDNDGNPGIIGPQFVQVKNYLPDRTINVHIGDALQPEVFGVKEDRVAPLVTIGLTDTPAFVYQHAVDGPMKGDPFAVRRTTNPLQIEVFWQRTGLAGVIWPYEMDRYQATWPTDVPQKYQLYVRAPEPVQGPGVLLSTNFSPMPFQEPSGHASVGADFRSIQPGWSLLKFAPSNAVSFQVVKSVWHTDSEALVTPTPLAHHIGAEITETSHRGPSPGYIHTPEGNRYDWEIYDGNPDDPTAFTTGQIVPVNTGLLEVWWANTNRGVQWWSLVKRYTNGWPQPPSLETITIASGIGSGALPSITNQNYRTYYQNDPNLPGFNPNDEHAFVQQTDTSVLFALRSDLGTGTTSEPYALLKSRDTGAMPRWHYRVFKVEAGPFNYDRNAGGFIQPPMPLAAEPPLAESTYVSGPGWRARTGEFYAKSAGNDGVGTDNIVMRYYYSVRQGFYFPDSYLQHFPNGITPTNQPPAGHFPWLDLHAGTPGTPHDVNYTIHWPSLPNSLSVYETLVTKKKGLPEIGLNKSVEILYDQAAANQAGQKIVRLIDPIKERAGTVVLPLLSADLKIAIQGDRKFFTDLPPQLRSRVFYDSTERKLKLRGQIVVPAAGEYYLLMNVLTARERDVLLGLKGADGAFKTAATNLYSQTSSLVEVGAETIYGGTVPSLALTAGLAASGGYVTLAFNNSTNLTDVVSVEVIRVGCPIYKGELKVIESDNPFDEKLTLRHSGDFAGRADQFEFEWLTLPPVNGGPPTAAPEDWIPFARESGLVDITIQGANLFTLSDNYFICRYRPLAPPYACGDGVGDDEWSTWTEPMLAQGWIKRVLSGINPYEQRIKDFQNNSVNSIVSMISQAGPRWVGNVPLTQEAANQSGLIETYESVLRRGMALSIDGGLSYGPANNALLLAAGRLSDLYMLLGNEAYADASDPTIAYGTDDGVYGAEASTIHCFQNQTASLMEEELALLRGRDDSQQPGVRFYPFYNKLTWNFTQTDGEVAYANNYDIRDHNSTGGIDETDARTDYPQGHGDGWGHYLSALKGYYRLLQNTNYYWVPQSEAVLVGGVPVQVDYFDERRFAKAAAAKARSGAEIVNLTYRSAFTEDPSGQYQGYQDSNTNRAWGVSEWASRAGQGAYFDWAVGNALLPETYLPGYRITSNTLAQVSAQSVYQLTDSIITNVIGAGAVGITDNVIDQLLAMPVRQFAGRNNFVEALDGSIGLTNRWRHQEIILGNAQTSGLPESSFLTLESFKGLTYASLSGMEAVLQQTLGTTIFEQYYVSLIAPYIDVPSGQPTTGIAKIDRTTVPELREIASSFVEIQQQLDKADLGLNPLGLARNVVPFDISPTEIDQGRTHFEQIYDRAVGAMNNAIAVFNHANNSSQLLRRQANTVADFQKNVGDREADFNNRLIEIFGQPYPEDRGAGKTYPADYAGPDVYHFAYVDKGLLTGNSQPLTQTFTLQLKEFEIDASDGSLTERVRNVSYNLSLDGYEMIKPASFTQRQVPGEIQRALSDLIQTRTRFERGLVDYDNLLNQIEDQAALLEAQHLLNAEEILILNTATNTQYDLKGKIKKSREDQMSFRTKASYARMAGDAAAEMLPMVAGWSFDLTSTIRGASRLLGALGSQHYSDEADTEALVELDHQNAKEAAQAETNIRLTTLRGDFAIQQALAQVEQLIRQEAGLRLELYNLQESLRQSGGSYRSALARGNRLLEDRLRFRQQTAAEIQQYRYKDMAFRIFRNDALQKYRAQFDLAAMYVYLAAKAYDFETNLREEDPRGPGQEFMTQILRGRTIGVIGANGPVINTGKGDGGLADAMGRMDQTWKANLKGPLGFNNPQLETGRFSLRSELLRIQGGSAGNAVWRETLRRSVVTNLLVLPEFKRFCVPFTDTPLAQEPAIVIPFSTTVTFAENLFGWPLGGGDNNFDATTFATKVRAVGIWFANYNNLGSGLVNTPRVYLIPVGSDVMRTPRRFSGDTSITREWKILDQVLPLSQGLLPGDLDNNLDWIPITDTLTGSLAEIRRFNFTLAYHDAGFNSAQVTASSRLIGRSVWNTRWLLIIPAGSLLADRPEAIARFIDGPLVGGQRTGNGVTDIKLYFQTYAYPNN